MRVTIKRGLVLFILAAFLLAVGYYRHLRNSPERRRAEVVRELRSAFTKGWGPPPDDLHVVARALSGTLSEAIALDSSLYLLLDGKSIVRVEEGNPQTAPIYTAPRERLLRSLKASTLDPAHIYFISEERTSFDLDGAPPGGPDIALGDITELEPASGKSKFLFSLAQLRGTPRDFHPGGPDTMVLTEILNAQLCIHTMTAEAGTSTASPVLAGLGAWTNLGPETLDHLHTRLIIAVQPAAAGPWSLVGISLKDGAASEVFSPLGIAPLDIAVTERDGQLVLLGGDGSTFQACLLDPSRQPSLTPLKSIPVRWAPHTISSVEAGKAYFVSEIDESSAQADPPNLRKVLWAVELPATP